MIELSPGALLEPLLSWFNLNYAALFATIAAGLEALVGALVALLTFTDAAVTIGVLALGAWGVSGWRMSVLAAAGLALCWCLGMWQATVQTIALVTLAVVFSVVAGIACGIVLARHRRLQAITRPLLDIMQTLPPWVYLVPAVVLFGLGSVPALLSTVIYGMAPMVRLTILALQEIPRERLELGAALGMGQWLRLRKIELPSALPTLLVGVNQCILLSLSMVVLAGLVGAGGLGAEVTRGLTRLDFGLGLRASLAIVSLALIMDRVFRNAMPGIYLRIA